MSRLYPLRRYTTADFADTDGRTQPAVHEPFVPMLVGDHHARIDTHQHPTWPGLSFEEATRRAALRQAAEDDAKANRISRRMWALWGVIFVAAIVLSKLFPGAWFGYGWTV